MMHIRQIGILTFINKSMFYAIKLTALSGVFILTMISASIAVTVEINTEFIADLSQPQNNKFVNKTEVSGFCAQFSSHCQTGDFSISIPGLTAVKHFDYSSDSVRNYTSITLDGTVKDVVLTDPNTGNTVSGMFRLAFFGMRHNRINSNSGDLSAAMSFTGTSPSGGCSGRTGVGGPHVYMHGWGVPEQRVTCYRKLNNDAYLGDVSITDFSFGYNVVTPDPLSVYAGDYEGEIVYSVGEGGDIDFNAETTTGSEIRIKIKATVRHAFQLKFPSDGDIKVSLAPRGGWSQWVNGGRIPDSLSQEVPFTLSSTSGFTVNMTCTIPSGTGCGLRNDDTGEEIPLEVSLTLPGFKTDGGSEVRNLLLNSLPTGHVILPPGEFVVHRRSQVDFRVRKPGVETMVKSPGSTWQGVVTLVFDTQTD